MTKKFLIYSTPIMVMFMALAFFEPYIYQNFIASTKLDRLKGKNFEIIAHKGASGTAPENTLAAFQRALDMGVDMIELDVRHTKDSEIIVFHDQHLDRTTNGTGDVHDYTLAQIKELRAGSWGEWGKDTIYADQKVPTLKEALDLINGQCKVLIEVKHMDTPLYHDFAVKLVDVIREEKDGFEWCILQSYEESYLEEAKAYEPKVQTKQLLVGEDSAPLLAFYVETRVHLGRGHKDETALAALNPHYETLSPRRIFRMHARGYKVFTYPVNERDDMIKMLNMGVDGIITDFPSRLIQIRKDIETL